MDERLWSGKSETTISGGGAGGDDDGQDHSEGGVEVDVTEEEEGLEMGGWGSDWFSSGEVEILQLFDNLINITVISLRKCHSFT